MFSIKCDYNARILKNDHIPRFNNSDPDAGIKLGIILEINI